VLRLFVQRGGALCKLSQNHAGQVMSSVINSIEDLRKLARRRVPAAIFEYADRIPRVESAWCA